MTRKHAIKIEGESLTQKHFKKETDVNNIVARYNQSGIDPYADRIGNQNFGYASSKSFTEAMQETARVQTAFNELPSQARQHFQNDPARWLDALAEQQLNEPSEASQEPSDPNPDPVDPDPQNVPEMTNEGTK